MWWKIKNFIIKNERRLSFLALAAGFIIDSFTLRRVDFYLENLVLVIYLGILALSIILINLAEGEGRFRRLLQRFHWIFLLAMQFSLGALWSAFLVFYSRSASVSDSWPFLFLLLLQLVGNEVFREKYVRLRIQIALLYFAIFSYLIFLLPVFLKRLGAEIFVLSGVSSLVAIFVLLKFFQLFLRAKIEADRRALTLIVGLIFVAINGFYFFNLIPPIPLSLKDSGVYHSIERNNQGVYFLTSEKIVGLERLSFYRRIHLSTGEPAYFFAAVFAPAEFNANLIHRWEYFDPTKTRWVFSSEVPISIVGGREKGFRTYSWKNVSPGLWRVTVETDGGLIIGRSRFEVVAQVPGEKIDLKVVSLE